MVKDTEFNAAAHLFKLMKFEGSVIRVTTYDDAIDAVKEAFESKGNIEIRDRTRFNNFVNRYLPDHQKNDRMIIDSIYKVAANEYTHAKNKVESAR